MFIGREDELSIAQSLLRQESSRIMVINGRKRIGKTTLAEKIAEGYKFFRFSGMSPKEASIKKKDPISLFLDQLSEQTGKSYNSCSSWYPALCLLEKEIPDNEKTVILFDEISWMAQGDYPFIGTLKSWWDLKIAHSKNVLLIFCGPISTWIEKNIINSAAFYGRISSVINLKPLSITDSTKLLRLRNFQGSPYEFYQILCVTGGIPWHLNQVDPSLNAKRNIYNLCFKKEGALNKEFEYTFNDIFSRHGDVYRKMLNVLSEGARNLSEIRKAIEYTPGGQLSSLMNNLVVAGFVTEHEQWNLKTCETKKQSIYRISDPYTKFYLNYIKPAGNVHNLPKAFDSIIGLQMETLLLQNREFILNILNINNALRDGPYLQKATANRRECQIDYLIQTDTQTLFLCEFKFNESTLDKKIIDEVKQKINRLVIPRGRGIVPVLFHMGGVSEGVILSKFFYDIINLETFLYRFDDEPN